MSKRKRNVDYIKPEEPAFLKRIKEQIGYKDLSDTVDTKRGPIQNFSDDDEDYEEKEDEKPQVVQIKSTDLTEEEAARLAKEKAEAPADLSQKIVFKVKKKAEAGDQPKNKEKSTKTAKPLKNEKKEKQQKSLLSFDDEDDDE